MADARRTVVASGDFREAVCIDGGRVYDSCCARDCLEDLRVYFSPANQTLVDSATNIRCRGAEVSNVFIDLESVNLNRGFYSCDITFWYLGYSITRTVGGIEVSVEKRRVEIPTIPTAEYDGGEKMPLLFSTSLYEVERGGYTEAGELGLRVSETGSVLPCGASARWQRD